MGPKTNFNVRLPSLGLQMWPNTKYKSITTIKENTKAKQSTCAWANYNKIKIKKLEYIVTHIN
jgi:hypothetical protein